MSEHLVLMGAYARAQARCSQQLAEQAAKIASLQAQLLRLNAALLIRDSAAALAREQVEASGSHRGGLMCRVLGLLQGGRTHSLARRAEPQPEPDSALREKSVLCIAEGAQPSALAQQLVAMAGGRYVHHPADLLESADEAAMEASLRAADLVICQTGCVSHGAWWRVQDHCRRTGKPCWVVAGVLTEPAMQPTVVAQACALAQPLGDHADGAVPPVRISQR